jgi:hypothetical protein
MSGLARRWEEQGLAAVDPFDPATESVVFRGRAGHPAVDAVVDALRGLGVPVLVRTYEAVDGRGRPLGRYEAVETSTRLMGRREWFAVHATIEAVRRATGL